MDRSVDSIGSCSLDVDADSSDISDTSGSLNFEIKQEASKNLSSHQTQKLLASNESATTKVKKPSYLSLACCVNGYSNLTTYDSKMRQEINKSREVSPIRPSATSIQYCKKGSTLEPPMLVTAKSPTLHKYCENEKTLISSNIRGTEIEKTKAQSFIQQRVERLFGSNALAQGYYSPKKNKPQSFNKFLGDTEEPRSFHPVYMKSNHNNPGERRYDSSSVANSEHALDDKLIDLPVLRHLSQEFRAQLPTISPKKSYVKNSTQTASVIEGVVDNKENGQNEVHTDINNCTEDKVDHEMKLSYVEASDPLKLPSHDNHLNEFSKLVNNEEVASTNLKKKLSEAENSSDERDGNHFLLLLKHEQNRLLCLAQEAEKYTDDLSKNTEISEDILGFLRLASGKARLLVSQKMKQFEGLCHNNLNRSPEDKFPTTVEDLEGFWDMVHLQVDHIDSIFCEISALKENGWKKQDVETPPTVLKKVTKQSKQGPIISKTANKLVSSKPAIINAKASRREAQRKELMELKRKQKIAMEEAQLGGANVIDIFVNKNVS